MLDLSKTMSYNEFINAASEEDRTNLMEFFENNNLLDEGLESIKNLNSEVTVLTITDAHCQDSALALAILMKLSSLNPLINVRVMYAKGNEEFREKMTGISRMPSMLVFNESGEPIRKYVEFPTLVKEKVSKIAPLNRHIVINKFRAGKFNSEVQNELIALITGENYSYTEFEYVNDMVESCGV